MDFGIISALSSNPDITKAAITGIVTSLGKVFGESGLKLLGQGREKFLDTAGELTQQGKELLAPIARKYIENYTDRHGQLRVLGMGKPVSLESIYTQVNFDPEFIQTFETVDTHEQAFRTRDWSKKDCRLGMKVANDTSYMMVLGGPGMGKSTFLRKVGLEALKQGQGEYQHTCIPVFLELRKYRWDKATGINLQEKIAEEFQHCGLPEYQDCTERLLRQGKLLILFDGLDEVPTELLGQMTGAIKDLVDRYSNNRFIASCRIAAYRSFQNFSRFTDVAIANFDEPQIQCFIENWFKSHDRPEWGEECKKRLNSDDHKATRELAQTPLLLTLICILFLKRGEFPTKRATLYDKALTTLLEEWDASKEIVRQQPYKGLDTKYKEIMLAEIAYINFTNDNLFFQQGEISKQIEKILKEMLTKEKHINGRDVLRAVEDQHGLLVNRYEDIYSFSHLTIQEFLTAKHIFDSNLDINHIVTDYLYNENWREVFLLLTGLKKADDLLLVIEQEIMKDMLTPKLQKLLEWVDEVTDDHIGIFRPVGKRAIAIANAYGFANATIYANAFADGCKQAPTYDHSKDSNAFTNSIQADEFRISYANGYGTAHAYGRGYATAINIADAHANGYSVDTNIIHANSNGNANTISNINSHKYFIKYVEWVMKYNVYRGLNLSGVIDKLKNMESQIPGNADCQEVHQTFARQLIQIFLAAFHITPEMVDLSQNEIQVLDNYLYGTKLLIECEHAAVRRTPEVWRRIEERLLIKAATN